LGVHFYLFTYPLTQNNQIWRGNTCGVGPVSWGHPRLLSQESGSFSAHQFGGSPVFMLTSFNAERPNSACNTCGVRVGLSHPRHGHCIARFVSDSWVSLSIYVNSFTTDDLQCGFKHNAGCSDAIFLLLNQQLKLGSCVYAAASECLNLCTFRQNSGLRRL